MDNQKINRTFDDSYNMDNSDDYNAESDCDIIQKLKAESFHLRLRCYNLDQKLTKCTCSRIDNEISQRDFYDQRTELSKVMKLHQNVCTENQRLFEENKLLLERCGGLNENLEKKLCDYECMKIKCEQLTALTKNKGLFNNLVEDIMMKNDDLIRSNVSLKWRIQNIEKRMAIKNSSFVESDSQFRISLAKSLSKLFKDTNESSFHNISKAKSSSCIQCDELKVYSDKLSETVIKMSVDFQSLNKTIELKNIEIKELDNQILSFDVDQILFNKCKVLTKKTLRKYDEQKNAMDNLKKDHEELIEFYIKQLGECQSEIHHLKNQLRNEVQDFKEREKLEKIITNKLTEVHRANDQLTNIVKSTNVSQNDHYNEVGQYSPQHRILPHRPCDLSADSDLDSTYCNKNISLNETAFTSSTDDGSNYEATVNQGIKNMKRKMVELDEVIKSYTKMLMSDRSKNQANIIKHCEFIDVETSSKSEKMSTRRKYNDDSRDEDSLLKKIYEEEKRHFDNLLKEKEMKIYSLSSQIDLLVEKNKEDEKENQLNVISLTSQYNEINTNCRKEIKELENKIQDFIGVIQEKDNAVLHLEKEKGAFEIQFKRQSEEFNIKMMTLTSEINSLHENIYQSTEALIYANNNFEIKMDEMEKVFQKVKTIIKSESHLFSLNVIDENANSADLKYVWQMLELIEQCLREKNALVRDGSERSTTSWKETVDLDHDVENSTDILKTKENEFYTSSLGLRRQEISLDIPLNDLTNITDMNDELLPEIPLLQNDEVKDKYKFIKENPEIVHNKMKYYYNTCMKLKALVIQKHEQNKKLNQTSICSIAENINEMTKQIDEFKLKLSQYKQCLEKSWSILPDEVAQELLKLNLI